MTVAPGVQREGARAQHLFREVNERIVRLLDASQEAVEFLCECPSRDCVATVRLTLDEYEAVRRSPTHFVVRDGHEVPEIERVVGRGAGHSVVEKRDEAGATAAELDPRS
jgi:hypothetical protein